MNYKIHILSLSFAIATALTFASCTADTLQESLFGESSPLVVYASIDGTGKASTRATITTVNDQWAYTGFNEGDAMGFYSAGGDWLEGNGQGNFTNQKLIFDGSKFSDPNGVEFSPSHMSGSQIFMYFPYDANIGDYGKELRVKENDSLRCIDLLSSNSINLQGVNNGKDVALYGTFDHAFSELIIMRGEGFDSPPKGCEQITAVLKDPITHIKIEVSTEPSWTCTPKLVYDASHTTLKEEEEAKRWDAWRGGNYALTENDKTGVPAWYVVVPTLAEARSTVEYIELYNNEGALLRVYTLKLADGNTKYVNPGWRYPMEVTMKELVPTVNPFPITPWNSNVDLTDERKRGINNEAEFANWVRDYNAYLIDQSEDKINALLKYGDSFVDANGNNRSWHFYVLADLDLSQYVPSTDDNGSTTPQTSDCIIPQLNDILDGISTTLVNSKFINHTIKGLSKTFIDKLQGNGLVQNFDFIEPEVINIDATTPAGIIANSMEGTSIINCNIDNGTMFNPNGPAGMVAGIMSGGTIKDCTLSGFLTANETASGNAANIVGQISNNATLENNNASDVIKNQ